MSITALTPYRDEVVAIYRDTLSFRETARRLSDSHPELPKWNWLRELVRREVQGALEDEIGTDCEPDTESCTEEDLRRFVQKERDFSRIHNNQNRREDRRINSIEELLANIQENLESVGKELRSPQKYSGKFDRKGNVLVVHLSDLHLQELVDLPGRNTYDFVVAAKRLQLLAQKVKSLGACFKSSRIVLAIGGDVVNSDRRHDEVLNNATNRSRAVVLASHLLRQFILDLRQKFYIDIVGVTGNEGRAKQELAWSDIGATDSYDSLCYWFLEQVLSKDKGITFNPLQANECVFTIHNHTFCLLHGHQVKAHDQKQVQSILAKFAIRNIKVNHLLCGHIHSTHISDFVSRNSSLCGSNAYSENGLNFNSKAAQNIHVVTTQGIDGFKADLQNVDGVKGYDCMSELQRHGARTVDKQFTPDTQVEPIKIC